MNIFGFIKDYKKIAENLQRKNEGLRRLTFRSGDIVFINDGKRDPQKPYYLLHSNGAYLAMWYVSDQKDGRECRDPVSAYDISHEAPKSCKCCGQLLQPTETKDDE